MKKKKKYSEPKVHFANDDLSKRWYVYFSFRKSENGSLERFPNNIYCPQHLNKKERIEWLKTIQRNLSVLLKDGFDPYNPDGKFSFDNQESHEKTISESFQFALSIKI